MAFLMIMLLKLGEPLDILELKCHISPPFTLYPEIIGLSLCKSVG